MWTKREMTGRLQLVYGINGIKKFFLMSFILGSIILCWFTILFQSIIAGLILIVGTAISGTIIAHLVLRMEGADE